MEEHLLHQWCKVMAELSAKLKLIPQIKSELTGLTKTDSTNQVKGEYKLKQSMKQKTRLQAGKYSVKTSNFEKLQFVGKGNGNPIRLRSRPL